MLYHFVLISKIYPHVPISPFLTSVYLPPEGVYLSDHYLCTIGIPFTHRPVEGPPPPTGPLYGAYNDDPPIGPGGSQDVSGLASKQPTSFCGPVLELSVAVPSISLVINSENIVLFFDQSQQV